MVYRVTNETQAVMRALVREGASGRKIMRLTGVALNTARRYIRRHMDEAPICAHGTQIYLCLSCSCGSQWGPVVGRNFTRDKMTAYEVCLEALKELLCDTKAT